ncbi:hypothetical protein C834K_0149 [Chlamydia poikilotherma]|uniref:Uncharacterized protein n=1 Tax=Chlamydia poikilotherma TaxID=1967783 RepID=A0A3B0PRJ1_9CHLA|nr:hypothetical protein [Chlamydia poikilotherma]SYX08631.1 hypothetical protein C834K_0149 [Chlamydia poikilotherma]
MKKFIIAFLLLTSCAPQRVFSLEASFDRISCSEDSVEKEEGGCPGGICPERGECWED